MKQGNMIYINGKFETPHGSEVLTLVDPVTEQDAAQVVLARRGRCAACDCARHPLPRTARQQPRPAHGWLQCLHERSGGCRGRADAPDDRGIWRSSALLEPDGQARAASFASARTLLADYQFERQVCTAARCHGIAGRRGPDTPGMELWFHLQQAGDGDRGRSTAVIKPSELSARQPTC